MKLLSKHCHEDISLSLSKILWLKALRNSRPGEKNLATVQESVCDFIDGNNNDLTYRRSSEAFSKVSESFMTWPLLIFPFCRGRLITKMWLFLINKVTYPSYGENSESASILPPTRVPFHTVLAGKLILLQSGSSCSLDVIWFGQFPKCSRLQSWE